MKKLYFIFVGAVFFSSHLFSADNQLRRLLRSSGPVIASEDKTCTICQRPIDLLGLREHTSLPCSHMFHSTCLRQWAPLAGTCPTCRFQFAEVEELDDDYEHYLATIFPVLLRFFLADRMEGMYLAMAGSDQDFLAVMRENFPTNDAIFSPLKIVHAHAIFLLVQQGRSNDAYRLAHFTDILDLVGYTIAHGANPATSILGPDIRLEIMIDGQAFTRTWSFNQG